VEQARDTLKLAAIVAAAFEHYLVPPGESLLIQNITAFAWNNGWSSAQVRASVRYARRAGWVNVSSGNLTLTNDGIQLVRVALQEPWST
jgi:hypothetical protein